MTADLSPDKRRPPALQLRPWAQSSAKADERLGSIYREFHQPLYRFCLAIVGNRQDAEDALQNTMVKVLRVLPGEKRTIALKPWLYRIAHNESIDLLRRRRDSVSLEASEAKVGEELAAQVETRERLRHLIADLGALPGRQRETLLMREAAGLSFEEIGAALETSAAGARQTLYEARLGLRQMDAGREMECDAVTKALSDGDGRVRRRRDIRAHLRDCRECRRFAEEIDSRSIALAAISPLPPAAAAALLQGLAGGGWAGGTGAGGAAAGGAASAGGGALVGGAAVKSLGTATVLKGAATFAVVAAIGIGGADRGGFIHLGGDPASKAPAAAESRSVEPAAGSDGPTTKSSARPAEASLARARPRGSAKRDVGEARAAARPLAAEPESVPAAPQPQAAVTAGNESVAAPPGKSGVEHPSGRGHVKQTPAAAAHGQETATTHKPEKSGGPSASAEPASDGQGKSAEAQAKTPPGKPSGSGKSPK